MSEARLLAFDPAPFVTLQDAGRRGWMRYGVSGSGAMDFAAMAAANILVGNPPATPVLEFAHAAGAWRLAGAARRVAVTGGGFEIRLDGERLPPWRNFLLGEGGELRIGGAGDAVWGYLAVAGGFALPRQLGSLSTHLRSGIGGLEGRTLRAGDALPLGQPVAVVPDLALPPAPVPEGALRVVLGPQDDYFTPEALEAFLGEEFAVSPQFDRLGTRLTGPVLHHARGFDIISDGVVPGCIQVPGNGQPIVLMRDCQPPGGYPKIATVITADLGRLAQSRAGTRLRFREVSLAEALAARRRLLERLAGLAGRLVAVDRRASKARSSFP
jgi:biotin-dependent carboxylase-like uncharacterized protein